MDKCCAMMKDYAKLCGCKWCPLVTVVLGVVLFLLGFFLCAEIVKILWLIESGLIVLVGVVCFIMTYAAKSCKKE